MSSGQSLLGSHALEGRAGAWPKSPLCCALPRFAGQEGLESQYELACEHQHSCIELPARLKGEHHFVFQ